MLLLTRQYGEPEGSVCRRLGSKDPDPVVDHLEEGAAHRAGRDETCVQIGPFHEQVGASRIPTKCSHLAPQSSTNERTVKVGNGLAFDDPIANGVVPDRECDARNRHAERRQGLWYVRSPLTHVNGYRHSIHERRLS